MATVLRKMGAPVVKTKTIMFFLMFNTILIGYFFSDYYILLYLGIISYFNFGLSLSEAMRPFSSSISILLSLLHLYLIYLFLANFLAYCLLKAYCFLGINSGGQLEVPSQEQWRAHHNASREK